MLDHRTSPLDHALVPGAQHHPQCADQRQPERLGTAACLQVIENGTAARVGPGEGENLRLSSPEIPRRNLRGWSDLVFESCSHEGSDVRDDSLTFWFRSDFAGDHFRHEELVRELTEKCYATDLAEQDEG
jgi:hypothetical protein